ncbi:MAG: hypothetical protein AAFP90_07605 [Planctomycetota bacterium]
MLTESSPEHLSVNAQLKTPLSLGLVLALQIVAGCAALNDHNYETKQRMRAREQYRACGQPGCEKYPLDYRKGWIDGFYAISTGGPCCPPAIAPQCYWDPDQILDDCDNRRHAYYSGWQDGANRAKDFPNTHYLRIFETCECPMPRCEPCADGSCGPCFGGMIHGDIAPANIVSDASLASPVTLDAVIEPVPAPTPESVPMDAGDVSLPEPGADVPTPDVSAVPAASTVRQTAAIADEVVIPSIVSMASDIHADVVARPSRLQTLAVDTLGDRPVRVLPKTRRPYGKPHSLVRSVAAPQLAFDDE